MFQRQILKLKSYLYFCSFLSIKTYFFSMLHHNANYWLLFGAIFAKLENFMCICMSYIIFSGKHMSYNLQAKVNYNLCKWLVNNTEFPA